MENSTSFEDIKELFRETDRRMQETDRRMQETDRKLREVGRQIGGLGNRLGDFVEGLVRPGLVRLFSERGIEVHRTYRNAEARRGDQAVEIDILVVNDTDVIAVEVKSKMNEQDVGQHIERLSKFKRLFPNYSHMRLMGALATMVVSEEAVRHAMDRGMFVIAQQGDDAVLLNPPSFEPKAW